MLTTQQKKIAKRLRLFNIERNSNLPLCPQKLYYQKNANHDSFYNISHTGLVLVEKIVDYREQKPCSGFAPRFLRSIRDLITGLAVVLTLFDIFIGSQNINP